MKKVIIGIVICILAILSFVIFLSITKEKNIGKIVIEYQDESGNKIKKEIVKDKLKFGEEIYLEAPEINGYRLVDSEAKKVILTKDSKEQKVIFKYKKVEYVVETEKHASIIVKYLDKDGKELAPPRLIEKVRLNEEKLIFSIDIDGYEVEGKKFLNVTCSKDREEKEVIFKYNKKPVIGEDKPKEEDKDKDENTDKEGDNNNNNNNTVDNDIEYGTITVKYIDETGREISKSNVNNKAQLNKIYTYDAKKINGYEVDGVFTQYVKVTKSENSKTIYFRYKKVRPPVEYGTIIVKYQDEKGNTLEENVVIRDVELNKEQTIRSKFINYYEVIGNQEQKITLTNNVRNKEIIFKYKLKPGTILVRYKDTLGNKLKDDLFMENVAMNETKKIDAPKIKNYETPSASSVDVTLTETLNSKEIVFVYKEIKGTITVKHEDESKNILRDDLVMTDIKLDIRQVISASIVTNYQVVGEKSKELILTEENKDQTITFVYKKKEGTITVKYQDESGNKIKDDLVMENVKFGEKVNVSAPNIRNYNSPAEKNKEVIITEANKDVEVIFKYTIKKGTITVNYQDTEGNKVKETSVINNVEYGKVKKITAPKIPNYETPAESSIDITLSDNLTTKEITFVYKEIKGTITVKYQDESGNSIKVDLVMENVKLGVEQNLQAPTIDSYKIVGSENQKVTLTEEERRKEIIFKYKQIEVPADGVIIIKHVDDSGNTIQEESRIINLKINEAIKVTAPNIKYYGVVGNSEIDVTLTDSEKQKEVVFTYKRYTGKVIIVYQDELGNSIRGNIEKTIPVGVETEVNLYNINNFETPAPTTVKLEEKDEIKTVTAVYKRLKGTVTIKYLDELSTKVKDTVIKNLEINKQFTENAPQVDMHEVIGSNSVTYTLTKENPDKEIIFRYRPRNKAQVKVRYVDENYFEIKDSLIEELDVPVTKSYTAPSINGYISPTETQKEITTSQHGQKIEVVFQYTKIIKTRTLNIKHIDIDTGLEVAAEETKVIKEGQTEYIASKKIEGYKPEGDLVKEITPVDSKVVTQNNNVFALEGLMKTQTPIEVKMYYKNLDKAEDVYLVELDKFNIKNNDTEPYDTTKGMNEALAYAKEQGYSKVKFPAGTYQIDGEYEMRVIVPGIPGANETNWTHRRRGVCIPSDIEVDFTGCTLKQQANQREPYSSVITISTVDNVRVFGGKIIADKYIHDYGTRINEDGKQLESGAIDSETGANIVDDTKVRTKDFIENFEYRTVNGQKLIRVTPLWNTSMNTVDGGVAYVYCYDKNGNYLGVASGSNAYVSEKALEPGTEKLKISLKSEKRTDAVIAVTDQDLYATYEFGSGINLLNANNIEIFDFEIYDATGDCILTSSVPYNNDIIEVSNLKIVNCKLEGSRRQGISFVASGSKNLVKNTKIGNIAGVDPQCGIDFEHYHHVNNTVIDGCEFYNNKKWDIILYSSGTELEVRNSKFEGAIGATFGENLVVHDNYFEYNPNQLEKLHKVAGLEIANTKNHTVYNNTFKNAGANVSYGSKMYGNTFIDCNEGHNRPHIRISGRNVFTNSEVLVDQSESFNLLEGIKATDSVIMFSGLGDLALRNSEFTNTVLEDKGTTIIENCIIKNVNKPLTRGFTGSRITYENCNISCHGTALIESGTSKYLTFNNCDISMDRTNSVLYGETTIQNSKIDIVTVPGSDTTKEINLFTPGYGLDKSIILITNNTILAKDKVRIQRKNSEDTTNVLNGPINLDQK